MNKRAHSFALVCAKGLGDALLSMTLAHNLKLSGRDVTIFSSILCELKEWFPGCSILPFPPVDQLHKTFAPFDIVIAADYSLVNEGHSFGNELLVLKENAFDKKKTMVENLSRVCENKLALPFFLKKNGIMAPQDAQFRVYPKRVCLHPMSTELKRNWPAHKFMTLSQALKKRGYEPHFCVSPQEAHDWKDRVAHEQLCYFSSLSEMARFIYESGYLIGNNSGLGHLASALGVPTLSLFARLSYAHLWRPGWGPGSVVCPPDILPGGRLRQKYWKSLLSVGRVQKAFVQLVESEEKH